jgi:hypothetical protein
MTTLRFSAFSELEAELRKGERILHVEMTPALAEAILNANPVNRPAKPGHVRKLARQMRDGYWNNALGGTITFDPSRRLNDGQHRLKAVIESEVTVVVDVLPNVNSIVGQDEGTTRTLADHLALAGVEHPSVVAAATRMLFKEVDVEGNAGDANLIAYYDANAPFFQECTARALDWLARIIPANQILRAGELAGIRAIAIRQSSYHPDKVDEFLADAIAGGEMGGEHSPAGKLYNLLKTRKERTLSASRRVGLALEALEQHVTGKARRLEISRRPRPRRKGRGRTSPPTLPLSASGGNSPESTVTA